MPLPQDILDDIKRRIDDAENRANEIEDVVTDLRASGIDASKQEEALKTTRESLRKLRMFYERQSTKRE